jgi:hypothetical protein
LHTEAANAAYEKFWERYPEIFRAFHGTFDEPDTLIVMGDLLRNAWEAASDREREWYLHDAESLYHVETGSLGEPPPPQPSALEQVLLHFRRNFRRALICRNPDCQTPYFLAHEKGQKYCSKKCSHLAQKEAKLRWWDDNRRKTPRRPEPSESVQPTQPTTQPKKGKR